MEITKISVSRISSAYNSRKVFNEKLLQELADSIQTVGLINPISVYLNPENDYTILAGERRFRAMVMLGYTEIPCIIKSEVIKHSSVVFNIIENVQREQLNIVEEIKALALLFENGLLIDDICHRIGKSRFFVVSRLKMSNLINDYLTHLLNGELSIQKAIIISKLTAEQQQLLLGSFHKIKTMNASELESLIVSKFYLSLENAPFDITSETLLPAAGACTTCKFNTAYISLFKDEKAYCNSHTCFNQKLQNHNKLILSSAPDIFVISHESDPNYKVINPIENNLVFLPKADKCPVQPLIENYSLSNYPDEKTMIDDYERDCAIYESQLSSYADNVAKIQDIYETQDVFKGIYTTGPQAGIIQYFYISNKEKKETIQNESKKEPVSESIDTLLAKKDKLEEDKLIEFYDQLYSLLSTDHKYPLIMHKMLPFEESVFRHILQAELNSQMTDIRTLVRLYIIHKIKSRNNDVLKIATEFFPQEAEKIQANLKEKYDRKAAKLQSRIDEKLRTNKPGIPSGSDVRPDAMDVSGDNSNVDSEPIPNAEDNTKPPNEDRTVHPIDFDQKPKSFFDAIIHQGTSPGISEDSNISKHINSGSPNVSGIGVDNPNISTRQQGSSTKRQWKGAPDDFGAIPESTTDNQLPQNNTVSKPLDSFILNKSVVVPRTFDDIVL